MEEVVLVDEQDREIGRMEKLQAHKAGSLHRAISVFVFNAQNELLLQQRAAGKYHSPLLWTNTCCSHPRADEPVQDAATRRLYEEMGLQCPLTKCFDFIYRADMGNGLTEHEYDHVFTGTSDALPVPDAAEVAACRYISRAALLQELKTAPGNFTAWFKICIADRQEKLFDPTNRS